MFDARANDKGIEKILLIIFIIIFVIITMIAVVFGI